MSVNKDGLDTSKPISFEEIVKVESERKKQAVKPKPSKPKAK